MLNEFRRTWRRQRALRRVLVDCGANNCNVLRDFIRQHPGFEFHAFEPQPELAGEGARVIAEHPGVPITFTNKAVWVRDETLPMFLATHWGPTTHKGGSSLLQKHAKGISAIDYDHPVNVEAFDFSNWLAETVTAQDYVIVKMDIEGAEYDVLEKIIRDGNAGLIDELIIEWHQGMNDTISAERHNVLVREIGRLVHVRPWH